MAAVVLLGVAVIVGVGSGVIELSRHEARYHTSARIVSSVPPSPTAGVLPKLDVQPAIAAAEWRGIEELRLEYARLRGSSPAAKAAVDEVLCELRARLSPSSVGEVVRALGEEEITSLFGAVALETWLESDSATASAWIAGHPARTEHHAWLVAHALTRQPETLATFCERLEDGWWADAFLDYATREVLRENPAAAISLARGLAGGERQAQLFETIASDWMERDPRAAGAWIGTVADQALRARLVAAGASSYASADALGAMEWLLVQSPVDGLPLEAARAVFRTWSDANPAQAAAWLSLLPQEELVAQLASR